MTPPCCEVQTVKLLYSYLLTERLGDVIQGCSKSDSSPARSSAVSQHSLPFLCRISVSVSVSALLSTVL